MRAGHTPMGRHRRTHTLAFAGAIGLAALLVPGLAPGAQAGPLAAAASPTIATPAGAAFTASLSTGTASFRVGSVSVDCTTSSTSGAVPAAPANTNPDGPVSGPVTAPTFTDGSSAACPTSVPLTTATSTTSGDWAISLQYSADGPTGTLTIPPGGVITRISGLASCTITVAPNGPAGVTGAWQQGSPPLLAFQAVPVPITVTGGLGCPTAATSATFTATYRVVNTTDPATPITVAA